MSAFVAMVWRKTFSQMLKIQASQKRDYASCNAKPVRGLALGVYLKVGDLPPKLTASAEKFDTGNGQKLSELVKEFGVNGAVGRGKVFNNIDPEYHSVAIVGVGREDAGFNTFENLDEGMENVRIATGVGARALQMQGCNEVHVDSMEYPEQAAEGSGLAVYRYHENKRPEDRSKTPKLDLYDSNHVDAWTRGLFKAEAQNLARRLSDIPANLMTPATFAKAAVDALCPCGVSVEVRNMEWIELNRINSLMTVSKGSCEPPVMLEISYCGTAPEDKPVLLVGKGMTFNSGGLCLRKCKGMDEFRGAMAGAAVVVAAIRAAAALSLPINISAVIPLCENLPSGMAVKPGDVITLLNGRTLCIRDTSKAGVVVMADPLLYGQATYKPRFVVDVATLGKGVIKGLGGSATGLFTNCDNLWKHFKRAGGQTGDRMWRLPLWHYFKRLVTKNISFDISNNGKGPASSCLAAAVLHEMLPCMDWAHLDINNVGMLTRYGTVPYLLKGRMTGRPTRTLIQFLNQIACPDKSN